jgi:hypothetical protein
MDRHPAAIAGVRLIDGWLSRLTVSDWCTRPKLHQKKCRLSAWGWFSIFFEKALVRGCRTVDPRT